MIRYSIYTLILSFTLSCLYSQTPEQYYFDWTSLPFSKEELSQRRTKLLNILQRQGKTGLVLIPSKDGFSYGETFRQLDDFYYFTGLELPNSILVMDVDNGSSVVYAPERDLRFESGSRPNDFPGRPLLDDPEMTARSGLSLKSRKELPLFLNEKAELKTTVLVNTGRPGPVSFASDDYVATHSPVQILLDALRVKHGWAKFENIYGSIAAVRMIKSPEEIALMRKAVDITVKGIQKTAKAIKPDVTERYLEGVLEGSYKLNGANRLAFGSIIKSGPNSLWPWRILAAHYDRRNRAMQAGELVILDVGCEYMHYVSDVGRTFPVSGKFSERQREILTMEIEVANQIIDFIEPGITFNDVKKLTDRIIPEEAKKYMQVGLFFGHHLGLSTGDPNLQNAALQPGMIFTVEPWYYNHDEQISVFTEDVILVTQDGCEILSKALPRTPEGLERLMKGK
jgi:Xaa-Pro aminopeptidase